MKSTPKLLLTALSLMTTVAISSAQDNQNQGGQGGQGGQGRQRGQGGQGGQGGNFNPEEFRQRMAERVKTQLKVTDEEWTVIQPLIEKVQTLQRDSMGGRGGGRGGNGGGGGGGTGGGDTTRPGAAESQALRTALESESTSPEDLKAKLTAVREVRKKNTAALTAARADLQKVVTVRQEAVLVSMGVLE